MKTDGKPWRTIWLELNVRSIDVTGPYGLMLALQTDLSDAALAPIHKTHHVGLNMHVWGDETRPRNQGASLTAYELGHEGVPHTLIVDNAGGHRTTRRGDVLNKIGTYFNAHAAHDNHVPFYLALPASTIDWRIDDGVAEILHEASSAREVTHIQGCIDSCPAAGTLATVQYNHHGSKNLNPVFDVTPIKMVTALITERGVSPASEDDLRNLFA